MTRCSFEDPEVLRATQLAGFEVIRKLGEGSAGTVWHARDVKDGRSVALKIPAAALGGSVMMLSAVKREIAVARQLTHPNIVKIYQFHEPEHAMPFIEMELVEGKSMAAHLAASARGVLSWAELAPLAAQLCAALTHAHECGIIHRDIKPANLLLADQTCLKLADFGCALMTDAAVTQVTLSAVDLSAGTLAFMSPQQLNGVPASVSDDLYAVGATLYTILTGFPPFHSGHLVPQILHKRAPSLLGRLRELGHPGKLPPAVVKAIEDCLSKNSARRPQSARDLAARLADDTPADALRRRLLWTMPAACLALAGGALVAARRAVPSEKLRLEDGFDWIFNGKNLDGWTGDSKVWSVEESCLVARLNGPRTQDGHGWRKEFLDLEIDDLADFELRLDAKLLMPQADSGNLGLRYRIRPGEAGKSLAYELDFDSNWKFNCGLREFGGRDILARPSQVVRAIPASSERTTELLGHIATEQDLRTVYREKQWNQLVVIARGNHIVQKLNGLKIVDFTDTDPSAARLAGRLGLKVLLYYGPSVEAKFRNLRLRRL